MAENKYVLAMYDIRGKQEYIYKSNKMKEIIGASYIIRDCFADCLYPAAQKCSEKGLYNYKKNQSEDFSVEVFRRHITEEGYIGEVIYDGGGNFFVLYRDAEAYRDVNRRFYRCLLEKTYSLRVLTSYIEGVDFAHYNEDQKKLYQIHRMREQQESMMHPINALPIVQVDYNTFMPMAELQEIAGKPRKVTYESKRKYEKYESVMKRGTRDKLIEGERLLDDIITEKGEESLLAVIYIDGNNMGAQVETCLEGKEPSYESSIKALRNFSEEIQKHYIDDRIEDVDRLLAEDSEKGRRFVVYAGDEITFICNAHDAYKVAKEYLRQLADSGNGTVKRTSCAGIAIFHSHVPFADAYRIAEECCESGKKLMKEEEISNASLIDYHYCQGAIGTSLEKIRENEENDAISLPWFMEYEQEEKKESSLVRDKYITKEIAEEMKKQLNLAGRSNVKTLLFAAKKGMAAFRMETERIKAHQKDKKIDFSLNGRLDTQMQRKLIYDMMLVYDLWFTEKKGEDK